MFSSFVLEQTCEGLVHRHDIRPIIRLMTIPVPFAALAELTGAELIVLVQLQWRELYECTASRLSQMVKALGLAASN